MDGLNASLQYVTGSTITLQNLENAKPGAEGFFATCQLLQRTTDHEVFRYIFQTLFTYPLVPGFCLLVYRKDLFLFHGRSVN